jgi:predicted glycogen debranching enzyme
MIEFTSGDYEHYATKEWIVTNGIGGYASANITGANIRRYHGLLIASNNPPTERKTFVSKVEEGLYLGDQFFHLSTNEYPGTIYPEGYKHIHHFKRNPLPSTYFKFGEAELIKTVFMVHGSNTTVLEYQNPSHFPLKVWLNPLYTYRDFHSVQQERHDHKYTVKFMGHTHGISATDGAEKLYFKHTHGVFTESRTWNKNLQFRIDKSRGNENSEDVYSIGFVEHLLEPGESMFLVFTLDAKMLSETPEKLKEVELKRLRDFIPVTIEDPFLVDLITAGDQFMVHRQATSSDSVIAGYHWFTDWGRDSMIAIRGLCIATGRQTEARSVIGTFLSYLKDGLIPNRFPDYAGEELAYNTADATLWLFVALYEYDLKFNDDSFLKQVFPKLEEIIEAHIEGTQHNIHMLENGLLFGGSEDIQITWMDARLNDKVFTPRNGCAVEINALWYNALMIYNYVAERTGNKKKKNYQLIATKMKKEFNKAFWNEKGYLNDVVLDYMVDESIRPNQIFAVSLPFPLLLKKKEKQVVECVKEHLLTKYGLRTLNKNNIAFKEKYEGSWYKRDEAYHQGTVWPFLLPEYLMAYLKTHNHSPKAKKEVENHLADLKAHFYTQECIHGISEVFDGLEPNEGKGCMHQAWSVSNLIWLMIKENLTV